MQLLIYMNLLEEFINALENFYNRENTEDK